MFFRVWFDDQNEATASTVEANDAAEAAERRCEEAHDGETPRYQKLYVRDREGTLYKFEVETEYEVSFSAEEL
jgi:hypothetical protein